MLENKKGLRNYNVGDTLEAGIVLTGAEVKSIRDGRINLSNSYVKVINGQLMLINADIAKYKFSSDDKYDSAKSRKLLIHKKQLIELETKSKSSGSTIIPIKAYFTRGKVKILIGMAKGKKTYEKKAKEKERTLERELHREKRKFMV